MKVGDLVRVRIRSNATRTGVVVERIVDENPDYFAWRVFVDGRNLPFHQRWLEPIDIVGEKK